MPTLQRSELEAFPLLENIPTAQLEWLCEHVEIDELKSGDFLFEKGNPVDHMILILEGEFEVYFQNGNNKKTFGTFKKHDITGLLPYSRAKTATASGVALTPSKIAKLPRDKMTSLITGNHELTEVLVHEMNNRIRNTTHMEVQNEKLIALGKLSAGLAHELNNPASAIVRSASLLQQHLTSLPADFKKVIKIKTDDKVIDEINDFMFQKLSQKPSNLSILERSELEDELYDWFSECSLDDKYDLIPLLVDYQFDTDDLLRVKDLLREEDFNPVLKWIIQNMTTQKTVDEIREASDRIETLIKSVKSYSYMDRNLDFQLLDIHEGIQNTLNVLNHKLIKVGHEVTTNFSNDVPKIKGLPGELNQIWTNLIDNAIDALPDEGGLLNITTEKTNNFVSVYVTDNGHGIPEDIVNRIFEPFYTTKEMGQGTGLGLDIVLKIVKQHKGEIKVNSEPGETTFEVCLPIK
ncbi:ATP-binding protein [Sungkyunkwania multivorans]|uniref:histidine kinase n=1 Tax=Sungkyunkwania multivorans TaxID=1173618 RepID=A0ABW3D1E4_9FLAO